ncbi:E3 ubiquitin-protein ligase RNF14 [Nematostella vectensis]|uniref:E3 ubiquitin-protein ligase RNF14 n=1 Tax=Nematostella vectensis TaxID=45351 RepID=UPI0020775613|nr:E3 ubiquitin-protein ligase RNF14 [Nematostella vectensis]
MTEALETQTRNQCSFCGNQEIILSCQGNRHIFCLECLSNCFRAKLSGPDVFSYRCPLEQVCGSVLCSDLTRDVLNSAHHGDLSSDIDQAALQSATKEPTQSCPNCSGQFLLNPHLDFQDLFVTCPHCQVDICQTCDHALGPHGVSEHLCTPSTDSPSMRHVVEELLTKASTVTCPNIDCRLSPIIKEKESCNMIKCPKCAQCFCYICEMLLGTDELEAHTSFPHVNPSIPSAPCCWIFDDEVMGLTQDAAITRRKLYKVDAFLSGCKIRGGRRAAVLAECRDILGEQLSERLEARKRNCPIM